MRIAILAVGLLAASPAFADEKKIEVKDLPNPVLAAVKAKYPEAKITGAAKEEEEGKTVYEVEIKDDDDTADLAVSAKGKILEVERPIAAGKLPKAVLETIEAKYPKAKIKKAEFVVKFEEDDEEKFFEVVISAPGKEDTEIKLSPKWKVLRGDDKDDDDDDKEEKKGKGEKKQDKKKDKDDDRD